MSEKTNTTGALDIGAVLSAARMKRELSIATAAMQSNLSQEIIEKLEPKPLRRNRRTGLPPVATSASTPASSA